MNIQVLNTPNIKDHINLQKVTKQKTNLNYNSSVFLQAPSYNLLFKGFSPKYLKAQAYLKTVKEDFGGCFDAKMTDVYQMDLNKLDGIQEGIKVFEGLNFKEITFIARTVFSIAIARGCSNLCSHCYADAVPHIKENSNYINKMSWDDYTMLIEGLKEINRRLGFYLTAPDLHFPKHHRTYVTPFHDSDCIELSIKDNENNEHNFIDIAEKIADATGLLPMFDTSGWTPTYTTLQKRAEIIAEYYSKPDNRNKIKDFNVSLNPFHALNTKSVMERRAGNTEKSEKLQNLYVERMANTFFTFTSLLKRGLLNVIARSIKNDNINPVFDGFRQDDLEILTTKILLRLKKMYEDDLNGEQRHITNKKQIKDYINKLKHIITTNYNSISLTGRSIDTFGKNNSYYKNTQEKIKLGNEILTERQTAEELLYANTAGIIDANGYNYLTKFFSTYPT